jgi:hypothetical protein
MPWVAIKTGIVAADGQERVLREYLCDWPGGCANVAEHVVGVVTDVAAVCAVCREHATMLQKQLRDSAAG